MTKTEKCTKAVSKKTKPTFKKVGQTKATPPEGDSLRKFYTSLYKQNKKSAMAAKWLLEHGLLRQRKPTEKKLTIEMEKLSICNEPMCVS